MSFSFLRYHCVYSLDPKYFALSLSHYTCFSGYVAFTNVDCGNFTCAIKCASFIARSSQVSLSTEVPLPSHRAYRHKAPRWPACLLLPNRWLLSMPYLHLLFWHILFSYSNSTHQQNIGLSLILYLFSLILIFSIRVLRFPLVSSPFIISVDTIQSLSLVVSPGNTITYIPFFIDHSEKYIWTKHLNLIPLEFHRQLRSTYLLNPWPFTQYRTFR